MKKIEEVNLKSILPSNGPSINEVKKYLEKYSEKKFIKEQEVLDKNYSPKNYITERQIGRASCRERV